MFRFNSLLKFSRQTITVQKIQNRSRKQIDFNYTDISTYPEQVIEKNIEFLKQLNFTDRHLGLLKRCNAYVFTDDKTKNLFTLEEWYSFSEKQLGLTKQNQQEILLNHPNVVQLPLEFYKERSKYFASLLNISEKEGLEIMKKYPKVFFDPITDIEDRLKC